MAAGGSLYHLVVDSDATATRITQQLTKEQVPPATPRLANLADCSGHLPSLPTGGCAGIQERKFQGILFMWSAELLEHLLILSSL